MKRLKVKQKGAERWVVVFEDFSSGYGGWGHLEPTPPFLATLLLDGGSAGRPLIRYTLEDGRKNERRVNRACCSTETFPTSTAAARAAARMGDVLKAAKLAAEDD